MLGRRPQAARTQQHHDDHGQRDQQLAQDGRIQPAVRHGLQRAGDVAQHLGQRREQHGAQDHARNVADAAQHHHGDDHHGLHQAERFRRDKALEGSEHHPRDAAERSAHAEGQQLHVARVDAHGLGGDLVFADGHPGAADARILQAVADQHRQQHQGEEQVVVHRHRVDVVAEQLVALAQVQAEDADRIDLTYPLRTVGDVHRVVQVVHEDADDFAEAERDDGQVVAAQLEHRHAEDDPRDGRRQERQRYHPPDRDVQAVREHRREGGEVVRQLGRGEQREQVGADGVEGHVAQVEQAGVADDDVQPQRQHDVQQREVGNAHPGVAEGLQDQGQHQQRDAASDPFGKVLLVHGGSSGAVGHAFAEQARRPQGQDDDQHDEGEDVGVVAAEHAARQRADVARADGLDQAEQDAADHGAGQVPDAAEHRRREGLEARQEAHGVLRRAVVRRIHDAGDGRQDGADDEGGRNHHVGKV